LESIQEESVGRDNETEVLETSVSHNCVNNKLYAIYQTVVSVVHNKGLSRQESVIINRLRIGHTRLTHSYLLSGDDQPTCSTCGTYSPSYTVGLRRSAECPTKTLLFFNTKFNQENNLYLFIVDC